VECLDENMRTFLVYGARFTVPKRFQIIEPVGTGAYGIVVAAIDTELKAQLEEDREETRKMREEGLIDEEEEEEEEEDPDDGMVAIKKIERVFEHKVFAQRTLRELKIQRLLQHENILSIQTILKPPSIDSFDEIMLVTSLMQTDLGALIKSEQEISDEHQQFFIY
jgi:serine/threonine protein kinase